MNVPYKAWIKLAARINIAKPIIHQLLNNPEFVSKFNPRCVDPKEPISLQIDMVDELEDELEELLHNLALQYKSITIFLDTVYNTPRMQGTITMFHGNDYQKGFLDFSFPDLSPENYYPFEERFERTFRDDTSEEAFSEVQTRSFYELGPEYIKMLLIHLELQDVGNFLDADEKIDLAKRIYEAHYVFPDVVTLSIHASIVRYILIYGLIPDDFPGLPEKTKEEMKTFFLTASKDSLRDFFQMATFSRQEVNRIKPLSKEKTEALVELLNAPSEPEKNASVLHDAFEK